MRRAMSGTGGAQAERAKGEKQDGEILRLWLSYIYCFPTLAGERVLDIEENKRASIHLSPCRFVAQSKREDICSSSRLLKERNKRVLWCSPSA
jgi:hypothetical protein